ncbi:hypothetical protein DFH06DRAFT_1299127, partial [Mycena polygramma]
MSDVVQLRVVLIDRRGYVHALTPSPTLAAAAHPSDSASDRLAKPVADPENKAGMPWLWPAFGWLWLDKTRSQAKMFGSGLAWPGFGPSHGFSGEFGPQLNQGRLTPTMEVFCRKRQNEMSSEISGVYIRARTNDLGQIRMPKTILSLSDTTVAPAVLIRRSKSHGFLARLWPERCPGQAKSRARPRFWPGFGPGTKAKKPWLFGL